MGVKRKELITQKALKLIKKNKILQAINFLLKGAEESGEKLFEYMMAKTKYFYLLSQN